MYIAYKSIYEYMYVFAYLKVHAHVTATERAIEEDMVEIQKCCALKEWDWYITSKFIDFVAELSIY